MPPKGKCISCSGSIPLPSKDKTNHRAGTENQQKCKEHNKKNLKGKYMLGFSPVKLYRVFYQPIFTARFYMRKIAGF